MMTALLSVGAWAENLWSGSETLAYYGFQLTEAKSMSAGDVLTFTVSETTQTWAGITLKTIDMSKGYAEGGTDLISTSAAVGTVKIVVTSEVAEAAADKGLWLDGNDCTVTSVDYEQKQPTLNLFSGEETIAWSNEKGLSSNLFAGVQAGDLLRIGISSVGGAEYGDDVKLYSASWGGGIGKDAKAYSATTAVTFEFDNDLVTAAKTNGLYIWGGTFTMTSVDIVYAPIELANAGDNTTTISDWNSIPTNITLADRTLTKDGNWNTLCLPFAVSAEQLAKSTNPLYGATIKELDAESSNLAANGTLTLAFTDASSIVAGRPYIVKWASGENVSNPLFEGVTITATAPTAVEFTNNAGGGNCKFVGQFSPFTIDAGNKDEIIMLGSGSKLGYSQNARTLKTFRAHFEVPTTSGGAAALAFVMNFGDEETTGIISVQGSGSKVNGSDAWYSLGGQRLQGAPTAKGVYIQNGRKVVVK